MPRKRLVLSIVFFIISLLLIIFVQDRIKAAEDWMVLPKELFSHRFVKCLDVDQDLLYVGTAYKLNVYNLKEEKIVKVFDEGSLPDTYITSIAYDQDFIWVGTPSGFARISKKDYTVRSFNKDTLKDLSDNFITDIVVDGDYLWLATLHYGVIRFDKSLQRVANNYLIFHGLAGNDVNALALDGQYVWAATEDGLSVYDKSIDFWKSYTVTDGLANNSVSSIVVDGEYIWAGTMGGGLSRLNKLDDSIFNYNSSKGLVDDNIQCLTLDGKFLWVGTFSGLSKYDKENNKWEIFTTVQGLPEDSISDISINGNYAWIGTDGGGVARFDKKIPQASLSPLTSYSDPGQIDIIGTSFSYGVIQSYNIEYRSEIINEYKTADVQLENKTSALEEKIAVFSVGKLLNGTHILRLTVRDKNGNENIASMPVVVDTIYPQLTLDELPLAVQQPQLIISGRYNEANLIRIVIENSGDVVPAEINRLERSFSALVVLRGGMNEIRITAEDVANQNFVAQQDIIYDTDKPEIIVEPRQTAQSAKYTLQLEVKDYSLSRLNLTPPKKDVKFSPVAGKTYYYSISEEVTLSPGLNRFTLDAYDKVGNKSSKEFTVQYESSAPALTLNKDVNRVQSATHTVEGTFSGSDIREIILTPGDVSAELDRNKGTFSADLKLQEGENLISATIYNQQNQIYIDNYTVLYSSSSSKLILESFDEFTSQDHVLLSGRFAEKAENLKGITLNPGRQRVSIDFQSNTFQTWIDLKKGENRYSLVMEDKVGTTISRDIVIVFDEDPPELQMDEMPTIVNVPSLNITGSFEEDYPESILVNPGSIPAELDMEKKTFRVEVPLVQGANDFTITASDKAGNEITDPLTVKYVPQLVLEGQGQPAASPSAAVNSNLLRAIDRLKKEVERLKSAQGVRVVEVEKKDPVVIMPRESAVFFVPFDQNKGDTLYSVSRKYLGSASYISLISAFNDVLDYDIIRKRGKILLPSADMISYLNEVSSFTTPVQLINGMAIAYNTLGYNGRMADYYRYLGQYLYSNDLISKPGLLEGSGEKVVDRVMVVMTRESQPDLNRYRSIKQNRGLEQVVVGRISSGSMVFYVL